MPRRDVVVIGGSAGCMDALRTVVGALDSQLHASVFAVIHLSARNKSQLSDVLTGAGSLPAIQPVDGDKTKTGVIYVAAPDHHLLLARGHVHLSRGPKEGLHRPSINATFRSAAAVYGPRVIGILLSGMLDDGASGLWEIARRGGATIVQNPSEARFPSMPLNALQDAPITYILRAAEIGPTINRLVKGAEMVKSKALRADKSNTPHLIDVTCPECHGPLQQKRLNPPEFGCRVGHIFSLRSLIEQQGDTQERRLYEALLALEEGADILDYASAKLPKKPVGLVKEASQLRRHAKVIRELLRERTTVPLE